MDVDTFEAFFKKETRSWLDWSRLTGKSYQVTSYFSEDRDFLANLFTVWYKAADGTLSDWRARDAQRMRVRQAAEPLALSAHQEEHIGAVGRITAERSEPPLLVLPCFKTRSGSMLILDGNHRAIAAFRARTSVRLIVFALEGRDDPLLLPDLLHEEEPGLTDSQWDEWRQRIDNHFRS